MELRGQEGDVFAIDRKLNNVYSIELKVMTPRLADNSGRTEPTHQELMERLEVIIMTAAAKGGTGTKAALMTWRRRLGHPLFKTVVELAQSGASGMVIANLPVNVRGLDACAACVAEKSVHLPHKEGRARVGEFLEWFHIDIAGPMPVARLEGENMSTSSWMITLAQYLQGRCASNQRRSKRSKRSERRQRMTLGRGSGRS